MSNSQGQPNFEYNSQTHPSYATYQQYARPPGPNGPPSYPPTRPPPPGSPSDNPYSPPQMPNDTNGNSDLRPFPTTTSLHPDDILPDKPYSRVFSDTFAGGTRMIMNVSK